MFKRIFGLLAFVLGLGIGGFILYIAFSGQAPTLRGFLLIRALVMPTVLIAFGITWMLGRTFGRR